ncbi:MAG: hypothetical protein AABN34_23445 [Acidobacteriota bacterium]
MNLLRLETNGWCLIGVLALVELVGLVILVFVGKLRRGIQIRGANLCSVEMVSPRDPQWVLREIERLCSGEDRVESLIKHMSAEDRALFDVTIIDSLNKPSRDDQDRLRSALIRYGYDEQCARRVMSEDFSDRLRASAVLSLLRPQWKDTWMECKHRPKDENAALSHVATRDTGPVDIE